MAISKLSVKARGESRTKTVVEAGKFRIIIDEPPSLGGGDEGPTPVQYMFGALAGCLNIVGHRVAREMGIDLKGIDFTLEGEFDTAKLAGKTDEGRAGYEEIRVTIRPDADASPALLEEWIRRVEDRCPVNDNISNPTRIKITLRTVEN